MRRTLLLLSFLVPVAGLEALPPTSQIALFAALDVTYRRRTRASDANIGGGRARMGHDGSGHRMSLMRKENAGSFVRLFGEFGEGALSSASNLASTDDNTSELA